MTKLTEYLTEGNERRNISRLFKKIDKDTYELNSWLEAFHAKLEDEDNWPPNELTKVLNAIGEADDLRDKYIEKLKKVLKMI